MFCNKCGSETSDQARFCNYCGAQLGSVQPQPAPAAQPVQQAATPQAEAEKPKNSFGKVVIKLVCVALAFFVARSISNSFVSKQNATTSTTSNSEFVLYNRSLTDGCIYGALFENDYLTYGMTRLHMPGFSLMPDEARDWLISSDNSSIFNASKQIETGISYDASDADGILKSYTDSGVSNATMVDFRKYTVDGSPVIRYIVKGTVDGMDEYIGELIVFPNKQPTETLRLCIVNLAEIGYDRIDQVFDTLKISSNYILTADDTKTTGYTRITAK